MPYVAAILLCAVIVVPLTGLPPAIGGIPIWYQNTFFWGLLAMGITGVITVLLLGTKMLKPVRWNVIDGAVFILFIYMALRTSWEDFIPQSAWIQVAFLAGIYGISRILWPSVNNKSFQFLLSLLLIVGIAEAGYGLGQLYGLWPSHHNLFPLTGTFYNPGPYSGWLACMVPVAVYGIFQNKGSTGNRRMKYLSWIYLFLAALVLFPASSRAAILAAVAGALIVGWPQIKTSSLWHRVWFKGTVAAVLIIALASLYLMKKDSADGRILIYKVTANMIAESPVLGWGWDGFPRMYNNFQAIYFGTGQGSEREKYLADNVTFGFNEVLEFTAEMGIIGLLLASAVAVMVIRKWRQEVRTKDILPIQQLGFGVMAAWMVFSIFSYPMSIPALALVLPVSLSGMSTAFTNKRSDKESFSDGIQPGTIKTTFARLLLLGISVYGIYWVNHYRPLTQDWMALNVHLVHQETAPQQSGVNLALIHMAAQAQAENDCGGQCEPGEICAGGICIPDQNTNNGTYGRVQCPDSTWAGLCGGTGGGCAGC